MYGRLILFFLHEKLDFQEHKKCRAVVVRLYCKHLLCNNMAQETLNNKGCIDGIFLSLQQLHNRLHWKS